MDDEFLIRPFQRPDRESLLKIAADTAFFGEPVENFMEDRRIFLDVFYIYYTDYEPEHSWVATWGDEIISFLTGCFDTKIQQECTLHELEPRALRRLLSGEYRIGKKFIIYLFRYYLSRWKASKTNLDLSQYPAHFHINVAREWRGNGIGRKLIENYLAQLKDAKIRGVHLQTTSYNKTALILYEKMGFRLIASTPSHLWRHFVNEPINELTYGMLLC